MTGLLGKKIGMTQIFNDEGQQVCVTVLEAGPCPVLCIKEKALQIGFEPVKKEALLKKPRAGYFKKLNIAPVKMISEVSKETGKEYTVGQSLTVDLFKAGDFVDVSATSIGKGFQGGMKRWNWKGGGMTHGSMSHRRVGSLGSTTTPGRVWKGHHLPGHMGHVKVTVQNLKVVKVDSQNNLLLVKGAVPGHANCYVVIRQAKKKKPKAA